MLDGLIFEKRKTRKNTINLKYSDSQTSNNFQPKCAREFVLGHNLFLKAHYSSSYALGKLFASPNRCPRTNIRANCRSKWRLSFISSHGLLTQAVPSASPITPYGFLLFWEHQISAGQLLAARSSIETLSFCLTRNLELIIQFLKYVESQISPIS